MECIKDSIRIKGKEKEVDRYRIFDKDIIVKGNMLKIAQLKHEYFDDLYDPEEVIREMAENNLEADLFTFWQRLPNIEQKFNYYKEFDSLAVLRIKSYDDWFKHSIDSYTRNRARQAGKRGVLVDVAEYKDDFVNGIVNIYKETPIRQGKPFWHYEKSFSQVKKETSDALDKSIFIGAYYNKQLIGFAKLLMAEQYAMMVLILSMIAHRDKSIPNALIAKAVEVCSNNDKKYLVYAKWDVNKSLAEFKINNGFEVFKLPRYFIPLTIKGSYALKCHLHRGISPLVPEKIKYFLNIIRVKQAKWKYNIKQ
jgi:hypothetical protein